MTAAIDYMFYPLLIICTGAPLLNGIFTIRFFVDLQHLSIMVIIYCTVFPPVSLSLYIVHEYPDYEEKCGRSSEGSGCPAFPL
jgi:hypothetical protein